MKLINGAFSALVLLLMVTGISAHGEVNEPGHHNPGMMEGYWSIGTMGLLGWIITAIIIAALILLIVWLVKQIQQSGGRK